MIDAKSLAGAFSRNAEIIKMQAEGLSHQDSLLQLPFRANCLNWVVGHIISNRLHVFKLLKVEHLIDEQTFKRYARESEPILRDGVGVLAFEALIHSLEQSQKYLDQLLDDIDPEVLNHPEAFFGSRSMSIAEWLFFFYFHEKRIVTRAPSVYHRDIIFNKKRRIYTVII